ncbi:hypothetical protein BDV26DRAFT_192446 [Aspergillus bertholletiae]|uniref:Uncharacterized protein n=1 Tax=Aspergillus bertholletiae TaxID=1226010 RepID=A0A5N7B8Y1_9EURO|nr:hypothetical protein BDV26DRAFT_192446 [Aspergillus bertholletiae]
MYQAPLAHLVVRFSFLFCFLLRAVCWIDRFFFYFSPSNSLRISSRCTLASSFA